MADLEPSDDSTSVILQARTAVFASLLISAIVLVTAVASQEKRQVRALAEVNHLIEMWRGLLDRKESKQGHTLAHLLKPNNAPSEPAEYEVTFSASVGGDQFDRECAFRVTDEYLIQGLGDRSGRISIAGTLGDEINIGTIPSKFNDYRRENYHFYSLNLADSERLWEELTEVAGFWKIRTDRLRLQTSWVTPDSRSRDPLTVAAFSRVENSDRNLPFLTPRFVSREQSIPRINATLSGPCSILSDSQSGVVYTPKPYPRISIDVTMIEMDLSLSQQWFNLSPMAATLPSRGENVSFERRFASLTAEAEGLELLPLFELADWIQLQSDKSAATVEIFGVKLPSVATKSLGVLIVLTMQLYTLLHLQNVHLRIRSSKTGDPGAFQAWILLYQGRLAGIASFAIVLVPTSIASAVFWLASADASADSPLLVASVIGVLLSWFVAAIVCLQVRGLRHEVKRKRGLDPTFQSSL